MKLRHPVLKSMKTVSSKGSYEVDANGHTEVSDELGKHLLSCGFQLVVEKPLFPVTEVKAAGRGVVIPPTVIVPPPVSCDTPYGVCVLPKGHRSPEHGDDHQDDTGTWWNMGQTSDLSDTKPYAVLPPEVSPEPVFAPSPITPADKVELGKLKHPSLAPKVTPPAPAGKVLTKEQRMALLKKTSAKTSKPSGTKTKK